MLAGLLSGDWRADACARAQAVYDAWEQDTEGVDEQYGGGGICDDVAAAVADALQAAGVEAFTLHYEQDNHTVVIARMNGRTVEVDIPLHLYESGSWYQYTKREGARFVPGHITVAELGAEAEFDRLLADES